MFIIFEIEEESTSGVGGWVLLLEFVPMYFIQNKCSMYMQCIATNICYFHYRTVHYKVLQDNVQVTVNISLTYTKCVQCSCIGPVYTCKRTAPLSVKCCPVGVHSSDRVIPIAHVEYIQQVNV